MEELIISVYLPAVAIEYECRISNQMKVQNITDFLKEIIKEDQVIGSEMYLNGCLFDKNDGRILECDKTLPECGYQSGDELMFI